MNLLSALDKMDAERVSAALCGDKNMSIFTRWTL